MKIVTHEDFLAALAKRHQFFHDCGCRLSDHAMETPPGEDCSKIQARRIFQKLREGRSVNTDEALKFKSWLLAEFGMMDCDNGWTQQYHIGALRNVNSRAFETIGPDSGYDSSSDREIARPLARVLDNLARHDKLPQTILYNLNPCTNEVLMTLAGAFQDGRVPGKIQFGSGWWFLDHEDGMIRQLTALSNLGLLSHFVGMLTDSRSFLSYTRHEYFRRILCNYLGNGMTTGRIPCDYEIVGEMVRDICFNNAARYFDFGLDEQLNSHGQGTQDCNQIHDDDSLQTMAELAGTAKTRKGK